MYEPTSTDLTIAKEIIRNQKQNNRAVVEEMITHVLEEACLKQFPFVLTETAERNFHHHLLEIIEYVANDVSLIFYLFVEFCRYNSPHLLFFEM